MSRQVFLLTVPVIFSVCLAARVAPAQTTPVSDSQGNILGSVPWDGAAFDSVDSADSTQCGAVAAVVHHGRTGLDDLYVLRHGTAPRLVAMSSPGEHFSAPVWAPASCSFTLVRQQPPTWSGAPNASPLRYDGELAVGTLDGPLLRVSLPVRNLARVLGWASPSAIVATTYQRGDLPEQRPALVDLAGGAVKTVPLAGNPAHAYDLTWYQGRLLYTRWWQQSSRYEIVLQWPFASVADVLVRSKTLPNGLHVAGSRAVFWPLGQSAEVAVDLATGQTHTLSGAPPLPPPPANPPGSLVMPYVHQVYDTPNDFNGHWACGPTSTIMCVAHFGRLDPHPITIDIPSSHTNDYGYYDARKYTAYGTTFDRMQKDASGKAAYGAYGWCTDGGAAWAYRMQDYAEKHNLTTKFDGTATFDKVKKAVTSGKAVALSTQLTSAGHIIAIKGITSDEHLVANDPYGDRNKGYMNYKGEGARYTFAEVKAKWFITVSAAGPALAAKVVEVKAPDTLQAGTTGHVTIKYKNTGNMPWDDEIALGTTKPRDHASELYDKGWLSKKRVVKVIGVVYPKGETTLAFDIAAQDGCDDKTVVEHVNLVKEGVAWFSEQGGPKDDAVALSVHVTPAAHCVADAGSDVAVGDSGQEADSAPDATTTDGSTTPAKPNSIEDADGCACRVAVGQGGRDSRGWLLWAMLAGAMVALRRWQGRE